MPPGETKWLQRRKREQAEPFTAKPSDFAYFRAYRLLIQDGPSVTLTALAKQIGVARQSLWRWRKRRPGLDAWVNEQLSRENAALVGPVVHKMAMLGLRGSVAHAELFLKHAAPFAETAGGPGLTQIVTGPAIINLAVPRPGDPPVAAVAERLGGGA